jgi:hypothetical protein
MNLAELLLVSVENPFDLNILPVGDARVAVHDLLLHFPIIGQSEHCLLVLQIYSSSIPALEALSYSLLGAAPFPGKLPVQISSPQQTLLNDPPKYVQSSMLFLCEIPCYQI